MVRELKLDAESSKEGDNATGTQPVQSTTVDTLLGRIKACQMAARVEATLYWETELSIMREISVGRSEVRFMIRTKNEREIKVLPMWAAKAWNPRGTVPSQTLWRFLLLKVRTLLSHHSLLRGQSIRKITLPDIFLYRMASTLSVNSENQPVVMVIAARNSKTSKDAHLQQSYAARQLEAELCAVGETGLWLHFILDQIGQFHGVHLIPPVDTSTRELAIDGTPRAEIAELGHWALDKMMRAYITAIPVGVVMKKAGYSGYKQDYFLGRSRVEPSEKLLKLLAEHIFPGVDDMLKMAKGKAANGSDADKAAVHFWRTLQMLRRIVAEDLAVKLVRTPWHPYEISVRFDIVYYKIDFLEELKKRDDSIASLTAEITHLTEALRTDEEASYELNVVQLWQEAKTVRDAWRLWNSATANDTRRLCDRFGEPGFVDRHTLLLSATQGALNMRVRHMLRVMDAVRQLRASDSDADTEAVVDALHRIAAPGIGTFADALTVLKPGTAPMLSKEPGMGVKGLGPKVVSKLRLACELVALNLKPAVWVKTLFPDTWVEQMPKTKADLAKPTALVHRPPTKRKKSA
ncbi:unnamed protein product [Closterium sp. NIES-64]|nr:unnamed protein product [Closterium sp. NIES-64]